MIKTDRARVAGPYQPTAIYHVDSDCIEYVREDGYNIYERVDGYLTLIKDSTGHNLVGFKLKGFRNMIGRLRPVLVLSDKQFLSLMTAIEAFYTLVGDSMFGDAERVAAYKAAYQLAANDNVFLKQRELLAA